MTKQQHRSLPVLRWAVLLLGILIFSATLLKSAPPEIAPVPRATPDITGYWEVEGDQDGGVYKGIAIIARHGSGVTVRWIGGDGSASVGAGMWLADGSLVASAGGGGVIQYKVGEGGKTLDGKWIGVSGTINSEKLTFLKRKG